MACLVVLVVAATVLTAPPGKLTHAARTSPAEAFWRAALPSAPMPEAIRELLRPGAAGTDDARPKYHDADPPPLVFEYRSSPRNEAAAPSEEVLNRVAGVPMPEAIRELLRHGAAGTDAGPKYHGADPPPLVFEYKSSPRNEAAAPSAEVLNRVAGARNAAASSSPTVFFLEEDVRVGGVLPIRIVMIQRGTANAAAASPPLRLYTVRAVRAVDGSRFVVCRRDRAAGAGPDGDNDERVMYGCRTTTGPARAYVVGVVGELGETATAAVVCRTGETSRWNNRARAAFRLLGVKPGRGAAAVCHAALDSQVIPVKDDRSSSLA